VLSAGPFVKNSSMARADTSWVALALGASLAVAPACGSSGAGDSGSTGGAGNAGTSPAGGSGGTSATGGSAGSGGGSATGGSAGTGAGGGSGGSSGTGGAAGTGGGSGGSSAAGGTGGSGGTSGTGGAGGGGGSPGCGSPVTEGTAAHTLDVGGVERSYLVVTPASLDASTPAPVLLGFHGGSGTAEQASRYGLTGTEPALYVYPQALEFPGAGGVAWNVSPDGNDDDFIDALLVELGRNHCIDTTRIFATGQSNGAFFVNQLGCLRPDAFRAIAPAAGGGPSGRCSKGVSAMIVHGTADRTVLIEQGMYSRDYWLAANGCSGAPSIPADPLPCVTYTGCAKPVLWCQHDGAHPFPAFAGAAMRQFFLSQ
jgi:polyhydroxybutyrate depolymerase